MYFFSKSPERWQFFVLSQWKRLVISFFLGLCLIPSLVTIVSAQSVASRVIPSIKIDEVPIGISTRYIGACEGNVNFDGTDLTDLGINTYRIFGAMARWEEEDDDGRYGYPSIEQIKANPEVINWDWWDRIMTVPENHLSYEPSLVSENGWDGTISTVLATLKAQRIRPVITLRNTEPTWNPDWALQLNPPRTEEDWNEWWEHVFAVVYWFNVRNDYQVDDWEIHNEPDAREQGWGGTQGDYFELVKVAADAITYVYRTYLPDRQFHIHAPQTIGRSDWPAVAIASIPEYFNTVNIHNYDRDISDYIRQVRGWMQGTVHEHSPLWLGEWGTYTGGYNDMAFSLDLIKNLIRSSQPGDTYLDGSQIFSLYDWGREGGFEGLIDWQGNHRLSYYAFRMGIRGLQGGRPVFATISNSGMVGIVTGDDEGNFYLLMVNDQPEPQNITADLSSLMIAGRAIVWEFSETVQDEVVMQTSVDRGILRLDIPAYSSRLVQFQAVVPENLVQY